MKNLMRKENMAVCILVGILLLVIAIPVNDSKEKEDDTFFLEEVNGRAGATEGENGNDLSDAQAKYINDMEKKVESILANMEGVGQVRVMITLKSSREYLVEKDMPTNRTTIMEEDSDGGRRTTNENETDEKTIYTVDQNGNDVPYVVKIKEPEIEGITVVASGGDNPIVKSEVTSVLQALFPLDAHKIIVVKMK